MKPDSALPGPTRQGLAPATIYLLLLLTTLFWGTSYGAAKIGLRELAPLNLAVLRFSLASLLFGTILLIMGRYNKIEQKDIPKFIILGFLAITSFFYIQFTGLKYTTNAHAGLILAMTPVLVACYSILLGLEKVSARSFGGITLALAGVACIITQGQFTGLTQGSLTGDFLMLVNAVVWAGVTLYGTTLMKKYRPFVAMAYIHIFGTLLLLPFGIFPTPLAEQTLLSQIAALSPPTFLAAGYLAVCCSVYSYFVWYMAVEQLGAVKTAVFSYCNPVFAVLTGILWFGEQLTIAVVLGGFLVFLGVYITNRRQAKSPGKIPRAELAKEA